MQETAPGSSLVSLTDHNPEDPLMHTPYPSGRLVRALARPGLALRLLVTLALLSAACSEPGSDINSPPFLSRSSTGSSGAASAPLGAASGFVVLGGAGVTCTASAVTGDVGSRLTVTQTPTCTIAGNIHQGDAAANLAFNDFVLAYEALKAMTCDPANNLTGQELGGQTLSPGVYCFNSTAGLTGQLTLDGPADGVWVFQITSALTTGIGSVVMAGGGQACNVYWQTGTAATIGTGSAFQGNILAGSAVTFTGAGSSLVGRALAKTAVTMTGTEVVGCSTAGPPPPPPSCNVSGDRVTGGGWIRGPSGAKANFGVSGGINIKKNAFRGHLEYNDEGLKGKSDDVKVKGTGVTAYIVLDAVTRRIEGTAKVNGDRGFTYQVDVSDNGEPGRNDGFAISLWNASGALVYSASGTLRGGNIQLHKARRMCRDHDGDDGDDDHDDDDDDHDDDDDDNDDDDDHKNGRNGDH